MADNSLVAFIPARGGSKRIRSKNIKRLGPHPLLAYAIQGAIDARIFDGIYVSTDAADIADVAKYYGATVIDRPAPYASDTSPDAEWIAHALSVVDCQRYAILRPTSPFRTHETICRAYKEWDFFSHVKAVQPVSEHPQKMWLVDAPDPTICSTAIDQRRASMKPLWHGGGHLCQTNTLARVYVQNASLELRLNPEMGGFQPFLTWGREGFDVNTPDDFMLAETLIARGLVRLPAITKEPYASATVYAADGD